MLRISKLTDYALLILSQMARQADAILSATVLAEMLHLTVPTVSKVLKILGEAGLVASLRGAEGGYRLARGAEGITVADIIAAMEGDIAMTECCENVNLCALNLKCTMRDNWQGINQLVQAVLAQFTLSDLLTPLSKERLMTAHLFKGLAHGK